uniref:Cyclin B2 n=1 Tax=Paramecium tetraurelia TaxID=5888 RepID=O97478_PARTE|nr:cyclin B2 [Paramecium tetraurelia]AAD08959.1 mitotic cyclin-CYC1b [Paramecium tetraurelia]
MIIENQRCFGKEIANSSVHQSKEIGMIVEKHKEPFSIIPKVFTTSLDDKENKLFRRESEKIPIEIEIDKSKEHLNPQKVELYSDEILQHLLMEENKYTINQYMTPEQQPDINLKMRAILVDWLVDVHAKFKLKDETLYITISLIDRYLSLAQVTRMKLQLVGVAALFIACKYEEIYPPALKDFVYITDNAYVKSDVLEMEGLMLQALNFNICNPTAYQFLQKYSTDLDPKNKALAQYILELALVEYKFIIYKPSLIAQSVIFLVNKIRTPTHKTQNENQLKPCAKELCTLLQTADLNSLQAVRKKFNATKFFEVSRIKVEKTNN